MRRSRVLTSLIAVASLAIAGVFIVSAPGAGADTANPEYAYEGWFGRSRPPAPQVEVPCTGTTTRPQCGPTSASGVPAPQAPDTGAYVVSSAGGITGDESDASGDTAWAAFQWDVFGNVGADVDKFVVTLRQTPQTNDQTTSRRNDTYQPGTAGAKAPAILACNIVLPWAAAPGANAWETRPTIDKLCVAPTVDGDKFTFDVTSMAQSWVEGTGHGFAVVPGLAAPNNAVGTVDAEDRLVQPFQITFSGYESTLPNRADYIPRVAFEFTPAPEDDDFGNIGGEETGGGGGEFFEEIITSGGGIEGEFAALPDLDVIPTDAGSEPLPELAVTEDPSIGGDEIAAPPTRPISTDTPFPWIVLLLLPLAALLFWGTGTALGDMGEPVPARAGGVSRVLAQRHLADGGSNSSRGL